MSLFTQFRPARCRLRFFGGEHPFTGQWGPRWARFALNRTENRLEVCAYPYAVKKQMDRFRGQTELCDVRIWTTGEGRDKRYHVELCPPTDLSEEDIRLIQENQLILKNLCHNHKP